MVFARREDAVSAVNRYSNVQLDGKPLKIEIVGTNIAMSLLENLTVPINYTKRIAFQIVSYWFCTAAASV
ncbi:hypothetical protein OIU78_006833 [Salix suchowensis]|nr:hypothetical protein OIU78_006833 [Salix suchowensis]